MMYIVVRFFSFSASAERMKWNEWSTAQVTFLFIKICDFKILFFLDTRLCELHFLFRVTLQILV